MANGMRPHSARWLSSTSTREPNSTPSSRSLDALDAIKLKPSRVCPLICDHGYKADGDQCSRITCAEGSFLNDDNECEKRRGKKPVAKRNTDERPSRADRSARERPAPAADVPRRQATARSGGGGGQVVCDAQSCAVRSVVAATSNTVAAAAPGAAWVMSSPATSNAQGCHGVMEGQEAARILVSRRCDGRQSLRRSSRSVPGSAEAELTCVAACELEQKDANAFPGVTLFTKRQAPGMKPTAVYLPPKHPTAATKFDVVIWLHGFYVKNHEFLFHSDPARLREQVRDSGKDVVLIAPFLGYEYAVGDTFAGNYSVSDLATANWGERYLEEIAWSSCQVPGSLLDVHSSAPDRQAHHRLPLRRW